MATVLPIVFASVVGRLMSEGARWRLERGASVGSLEQLMGSRTVGGAIVTLFQFHSWNRLTLALLALWALSPLGTQSLLRMSKLHHNLDLGATRTTYFDSSARSQLVDWASLGAGGPSSSILKARLRAIAGLYSTLVSTPESIKLDTMDPWGNVKIPYLHPESGSDWRDIRQDLTTDDYSSLAGVPLSDLNYDGKTTFSLESSYIQLQCSNITTSPLSEPDGSYRDMMRVDLLQSAFSDFISISGARHIYELPNGTWHGVSSSRNISSTDTTWSLGLDRFIDPLWFGGNNTNFTEFRKGAEGSRAEDLHRLILFQDQKGIEAGPTRLLFQAKCKDSSHAPQLYFTGYCDVTQRYVESRVTCDRSTTTRQNCSVVAQRPSQQMHAPESLTPLSFPVIFHDISQELPLAVGGDVSFQTETSLYYIKDPSLRSINGEERAFLENVTARDLGVR